jgi:hypothetical protein
VNGRPGWIVGVVALVVLGYITLNTIRTPGQGGAGVRAGSQLPPFAAPLAAGRLDGDASVQVRAGGGHPAACTVRGPDVLNSCELAERGPVVLAFLVVPSGRCERQVGVLDRVRARFPDVGFGAVAIRGSRADVRAAIARGRWRLPVGWDRDGAVSNAYAIAVCPTIVLARRGGTVLKSLIGVQDEATLAREVARLR